MTLLEIAKSKPRKQKPRMGFDPEKLELVIAYVNDEVSSGQIIETLGMATGALQNFVASTLLQGCRAGLVKISMNGK